MTKKNILTINGGSSSIKFALFKADDLSLVLSGGIDRIGHSQAVLKVKGTDPADDFSSPVTTSVHRSALDALMRWLEEKGISDRLAAVGHRLVSGGPKYIEPQKVTHEMVKELLRLSVFDPEHMPMELLLVDALHRQFSNLPQVACFDTAFFHDLPRVARMLPIPRRYEAQGVRRYGYHGISYSFLIEELARVGGTDCARGRVILSHLGNGASLTAALEGKALDTSMGFTPASGVPMGTRSGDLDPGLALYLEKTEDLDAEEFNAMANFRSGLLGVSETSSDMRDLLESETGDIRAAEAVALFCYEVKKRIGSFAAALGGLDSLVFSAGIGENCPVVRERICDGLKFLGIELDKKLNLANEKIISAASSRVKVFVIHTDEERVIAEKTRGLV